MTTNATTKERLHRLIDALPDSNLAAAEEALASLTDPVLRAFLEAPEDDEPLAPEDVAAIEQGKAEIERGELVGHAAIAWRSDDELVTAEPFTPTAQNAS